MVVHGDLMVTNCHWGSNGEDIKGVESDIAYSFISDPELGLPFGSQRWPNWEPEPAMGVLMGSSSNQIGNSARKYHFFTPNYNITAKQE